MEFVASALNYLLGIPVLGWGTDVGFVYKGVLLLLALLIFTAYILLADRKIWAAVQVRRGPNVVGPFGLLQSFADLLKFLFKEPMVPASSDKVVFLLAPLVTSVLALSAWVVIPLDAGWALANINVGILYIFANLVAGRLWHHHGRLGVELEIRLPRRAALRRAGWSATKSRSASSSSPCCSASAR